MKKLLPIIIPVVLLAFSGIALAQSIRTITVIPPTVEQKLDAGGYAEGTLKVVNQTDQPVIFQATVQDYIVDNNNGVPHLLPPGTLSGKYSAASWIGVYPQTFTVGPQQRQELSYYVQIPSDAKPGGHYAAIIYTPVQSPAEKASGASVNAQTGTLFYITVNGPVTENALVTKFTTNKLWEFGPVEIKSQIRNDGDVHEKPVGAIVLYDIFGRRSQVSPLNESNIFPGGVARDYVNKVGGKIMIGPYTAKLLASYGANNNLPLSASVSFFVFPWRIAIVLILIIVSGVLGYKYWNKRKKNPTEEKQEPKTSEGPTVIKN